VERFDAVTRFDAHAGQITSMFDAAM